MLEKKVIRYTRGGMQEVNLVTGEKHQLTESKEHEFRHNQENRFHDEKAAGKQPGQAVRVQGSARRQTSFREKAAEAESLMFRPSRAKHEGVAKKKTYRVVEKKMAAQSAVSQKGAAKKARFRAAEKESMQRRLRASLQSAALAQALRTGGNKASKETDDSFATSAASTASRSFQTSTDFVWKLLHRKNKKKKEEEAERAHRAAVEKKAAKQAAEKQAAKKAAETTAQIQQQAAKGTAAAASKATAAAVPAGAVVVLVLLVLLLLGIIIFLISCVVSLFGGVTASLNNPALEAYVLSLDDSFEQEVRAEMESGDKVDGSFPKTNAYALAVLATGDWVADPLTDEIKEEMARIHDLLYSFKKEEETIKEEPTTSGSIGHITTIHVFKITARKPEDIVPELGISEERQAFLLRQLETLYQLQTIPGIGGGEIITPDSDWIGTGIFQWPLPETGTITSYFGNRVNPITGEPDYHTGTDISVAAGTPILAAADGVVSIANGTDSWGDSYGYYVKLDHGEGLETLYAHCSSICVTAGQEVAQGEVIAYVGSTGNSTGNHLHFEVRVDGTRVDALDYFTTSEE